MNPGSQAVLQWRLRMGLGQVVAARELGYSLAAYQEVERGARFRNGVPVQPDLVTLYACAAVEAGLAPKRLPGNISAPHTRRDVLALAAVEYGLKPVWLEGDA